MRRIMIATAVALSVTACGGGRSASLLPPKAAGGSSTGSATVAFRIVVPAATKARARSPRYVSPATQSASVAVAPAGGAAGAPVVVDCTSSCNGQIAAPVGSDTFTVKLYDVPGGTGNVLSSGSITQTIVADQANTVSVTFNGVVASVGVSLNPSNVTAGTPATVAVTVNALDAAGNTIVGPGVYADANGNPLTIALSNSDTTGATKLSATSVTAPGASVTLAYNGAAFASASITAAATGLTSATAVLGTGCGSAPNTDLYVASLGANLAAFPLTASGNAAPTATLNIGATAVGFDAQGGIYAASLDLAGAGRETISVYCAGATGNASAVRTIVPPLSVLASLTVDGAGTVYYGTGTTISVFAPGAGSPGAATSSTPPTAPQRQIVANATAPFGVDSTANLYVSTGAAVNVYGPTASGNAAPSRQIVDARPGFDFPGAPAVDGNGNLYALYSDTNSPADCPGSTKLACGAVVVTPAGTTGPPSHVLLFPASFTAYNLAVDAAGDIAVLGTQGKAYVMNVYAPGHQDGAATPTRSITPATQNPIGFAIDNAGTLYVGDGNGGSGSVFVYPVSGPARTFASGSKGFTTALAVAGDGTAYVVKQYSPIVEVYAPGAGPSDAPIRTLDVSAAFPQAFAGALALDGTGALYVVPFSFSTTAGPTVAVYAPGSSGGATPLRSFTDPLGPVFDTPYSAGFPVLAVDPSGVVYISHLYSNVIDAYAPGSSGTVSPVRQIAYNQPTTFNDQINTFSGYACVNGCNGAVVYVDAHDNVYVASTLASSIEVFPKGASTPSRTIFGPRTRLAFIESVAADASGTIYVTDVLGVFAFAPNANGNVAPVRALNRAGAYSVAVGPGP